MFRTPTDDPSINEAFYEKEYAQGFTTDTPTDAELARLIESNFVGTEKDYSYYISVLKQLGLRDGAHVFDYGCSWGYGSYQLAKTGFEVTSFEIAPTRRRYAAEKLGVSVVCEMNEAADRLTERFDCFFSAHVLEHVPSPGKALVYAMRLLKMGGLFVSFTPNGSEEYRAAFPEQWSKLWGEVHPNFIDERFVNRNFRQSPRTIGSSPVKDAVISDGAGLRNSNKLDSSELFFAARKVAAVWG